MNKRLFKVFFIFILLIGLIFTSNNIIYASTDLYSEFEDGVSNGSSIYKRIGNDNSFIKNEFVTVYGFYSYKSDKYSVNLLIINNLNDLFIELTDSDSSKKYYSETYSIIYNYKYEDTLTLNIYLDEDFESLLTSFTFENFESLDDFKLTTYCNGEEGSFPSNSIRKYNPYLYKILSFVCTILSFVIVFVLIILLIILFNKDKKKRYAAYSNRNSYDNTNNVHINSNVIDSYAEEVHEEKVVYNKEYLKELFKKKMNHEISDVEFDREVKKYFNHSGDDDDN